MAPAPRPIVTFTSDFGAGSGYPAQMKAEVLRVLPDATLVDLSHDVPPFDLVAGALLLERCVPRFPPPAVHVAVVDPGVGTRRRPLCVVDPEGRRLVGPDNGLLTPFLGPGSTSREVRTPGVVPEPRLATFHGRDLFSPVAAWLAGGGQVEELGPVIDDPVRIEWPAAERSGGEVRGRCLAADSFGNVITSIREEDLDGRPVVEVRVAGTAVPFVRTFGDVERGSPAALVGSSGRIEVVVREGRAERALSLARGALVVVRLF